MHRQQPNLSPAAELLDPQDLPAGGETCPPPMPKVGRLQAGDLCPTCQNERLDYDGLLNLSCPRCGVVSAGCFT
jgi:hypothetical protein